MAKTKISEFSTTAGNNTDINSINIAEGCAPSGINDAIRELMRQLKEFQTGGAGDSVNSGGDFSVATNKFTVASASGNTAVAGTLGVTGAATLSSTLAVTGTTTLTGALVANGNATLGDGSGDTVTVKGTPTLEVNPTLSGGTANGVLYLNGSKVATSGSALTFASSTLTVNNTVSASNGTNIINVDSANQQIASFISGVGYGTLNLNGSPLVFQITGSEAMRLTSTGLGIGTSSPSTRLHVVNNSANVLGLFSSSYAYGTAVKLSNSSTGGTDWTLYSFGQSNAEGAGNFGIANTAGNKFTLDTSGNLGLGVTPSAWGGSYAALQIKGGVSLTAYPSLNNTGFLSTNAYFDGTDWKYISSSYATRYKIQNADGVHSWDIAASGTAGNAITFTQAMTLDASGNLGIGTTSPGSRISAIGSANLAYFYDGSTSDLQFQVVSSVTVVGTTTPSPLAFKTNNSERARIDSSGRFMIGTTSTAAKFVAIGASGNTYIAIDNAASGENYFAANAANIFQTAGSERARIDSSGNFLFNQSSAGYQNSNSICNDQAGFITINHIGGTSSGTSFVNFGYGASGIGSITQSGTAAVLYNVTSDQRLKENIVDAPEFGSVIDSIKVRSYDWKADGNHQRAGFVAQELVTVAPEAVHQPADPEEMMAVDYSKLVPMLVKEIQSLRKRLADAGIA